jgi:hypothetical protein
MPPLPGMELGPEPPSAPRELPKGFEQRQKWLGNPLALVGGIFLLVGLIIFSVFIFVLPLFAFFPFLFIALGWFIMRAGRRMADKVINAVRNGRAVKGNVTEVHKDLSTEVNGRNPWRIHYAFTARDGQVHEGSASTFDSTASSRQPGQPVWVLVVDDHPEQNTIYPPVK